MLIHLDYKQSRSTLKERINPRRLSETYRENTSHGIKAQVKVLLWLHSLASGEILY